MSLPAHFGENFHRAGPYYYDVLLILILVILGVCLSLGLPGSDFKQRAQYMGVLLTAFYFGAAILGVQFSHDWESAHVETDLTLHRNHRDSNRSSSNVRSSVDLYLGLRGINITFKNRQEGFHFNENFDWAWEQGRDGFGKFAGSFNRVFREGQNSGLPGPILWVADMFTHDGEGFRFGRAYRTAGWHVHSLLWSAFIFWLMAVLSFRFSVAPAAKFLSLSGAMLVLANIVWAGLTPALKARPPVVLLGSIPGSTEAAELKLRLGAGFYICLITGLLALFLSIGLLIVDSLYPVETALFFNLDPLLSFEECYVSPEEAEEITNKVNKRSSIAPANILRRLSRFAGGAELGSNHEMSSLVEQPISPPLRSQPKDQVLIVRRKRDSLLGPPTSQLRQLVKSSPHRLDVISENPAFSSQSSIEKSAGTI